MLGRFKPRVVAAQRLQSLLLVTALAAGALSALLVLDLVSGMRSVAISEAENALTAALRDLGPTRPATGSAREAIGRGRPTGTARPNARSG